MATLGSSGSSGFNRTQYVANSMSSSVVVKMISVDSSYFDLYIVAIDIPYEFITNEGIRRNPTGLEQMISEQVNWTMIILGVSDRPKCRPRKPDGFFFLFGSFSISMRLFAAGRSPHSFFRRLHLNIFPQKRKPRVLFQSIFFLFPFSILVRDKRSS